MKIDGRRDLVVQKSGDSLPEYLNHYDPPEASARPLGNQYNCLTHALCVQSPITKRCLHDGNNLLQVGSVRCVVPRVINQPLVGVFRLYYRRSA